MRSARPANLVEGLARNTGCLRPADADVLQHMIIERKQFMPLPAMLDISLQRHDKAREKIRP